MKTIFISGASQGIGLGIARRFYQEGFKVIICARGQEKLDKAKAEMPNLHTYVCDISKKAAVKEMAAWLNETYGTLDVLVNNGGTFLPGQLHSESDDTYELLMATNMDSTYYLTKGVLPKMMERKSGTIFNIASVASIKPYQYGGSYGISKYAMLGFSKNLREEMKEFGIRVISIMPGAVRTPSWDAAELPDERFIPVEDISSLVWNAYAMSERTVIEDIVVRPFLGDI